MGGPRLIRRPASKHADLGSAATCMVGTALDTVSSFSTAFISLRVEVAYIARGAISSSHSRCRVNGALGNSSSSANCLFSTSA